MHNPARSFIVVEGLDGAGTTTQTNKLYHYFTQKGADSFATREPTGGPVGSFIRRVLSRGVVTEEGGAPWIPGERELALLFAADRLEHTREIASRREHGALVICDRYVFSSMAYQTLDPSISAEWVRDINRGCAVPDVTFLLSVPAEECLRRIRARNEQVTVYEKLELLERISENYTLLSSFYEDSFGPLVIIDGTKPEETVHKRMVETLHRRFGV